MYNIELFDADCADDEPYWYFNNVQSWRVEGDFLVIETNKDGVAIIPSREFKSAWVSKGKNVAF